MQFKGYGKHFSWEHDEETIRTADYAVDIGPGAGEHGGEIIAAVQRRNHEEPNLYHSAI